MTTRYLLSALLLVACVPEEGAGDLSGASGPDAGALLDVIPIDECPVDDVDPIDAAEGLDAACPAPREVASHLQATWDALIGACEGWRDAGRADYTYLLRRSCRCDPEYTRPVTVAVCGGELVSASYSETGEAYAYTDAGTMFDLFHELAEAIEDGPAYFELELDEAQRYPVEASWGGHRADDAMFLEAWLVQPM